MLQKAVGIGVSFNRTMADGYYMVETISKAGGAFTSVLAVGDRVISIDQHDMRHKTMHDLKHRILGLEGTSLTVGVRCQNNTLLDIEVKRLLTPSDIAADASIGTADLD